MGVIKPLSGIGADAIESLLDNAFGTDRHRRTAYLLRQGTSVIDHLSFATIESGVPIGTVQCWPVSVGDAPLILVGPVAVRTTSQNQGVGHRLMQAMLAAVTDRDAPMVMIGDPGYYGRFGFSADGTAGWTLPGPWEPHRLLLRNQGNRPLPETGMIGPRL